MTAFDLIAQSLWVVSNLTVFYIMAGVVAWFVLYLRFRWATYDAGRDVFVLVASLMGLIVLTFTSIFANPLGRQTFYQAPDAPLWFAVFRYLVYLAIAIALTRIDSSLIRRIRAQRRERRAAEARK